MMGKAYIRETGTRRKIVHELGGNRKKSGKLERRKIDREENLENFSLFGSRTAGSSIRLRMHVGAESEYRFKCK